MGEAMVPGLRSFPRVVARAKVDDKGLVVVDVRAEVTDGLLRTIADLGATATDPIGGSASFASNIQALRNSCGCDIDVSACFQ